MISVDDIGYTVSMIFDKPNLGFDKPNLGFDKPNLKFHKIYISGD
jgi:hypothetical protein